MQRARAFESNRQPASGRSADGSALRPTPLTLVSGAIAGGDLESIAVAVAEVLGQPVVIAIPAMGGPVISPRGALPPEERQTLCTFADQAVRGELTDTPTALAEAVPVHIGEQVVGIVAAGIEPAARVSALDRRAWLEAAAAAASVTALIREAHDPAPEDAQAALLWELLSGPAADLSGFLARARRLGVDLGAGAAAICAERGPERNGLAAGELARQHGGLLAEAPGGRLFGLAPAGVGDEATEMTARLREHGMTVTISAARRDPALLHEALREAELLIELTQTPGVQMAGHDETYRLLIGVLLRDPDELGQLRASTISPLADYDSRHDTDLLATLQAFLAHDGSTTETAEAMQLHRHTVGYRLARVQEVSGLSPYESDGRERLSLGLKAHHLLVAAGNGAARSAR